MFESSLRVGKTLFLSNKTILKSTNQGDRRHQNKNRKKKTFRKPTDLRMVIYTDLDYAYDNERKSVSGVLVTLGGSPTYFISKIQLTVSLSLTKAEYIVLGSITQ